MSAGTLDAKKLADRQEQVKQAEEMLGQMPHEIGFAKGLFFGQFHEGWLFPYPRIVPGARPAVDAKVAEVKAYCDSGIDPDAIDRGADIPRSVIDGLARIGLLGLTAPKEIGGHGMNQGDYCRMLEVLGGRCSSTSIFVNAHHSIGMRALLLFGTEAQKTRWLPDMVAGRKLGAFALTEEQAGSDAANVQTVATPSEDGSHFILNGTKRYITNAAIADVLTVMARTPVPGSKETKITAFLVTPDMLGFEIVKARGEKMGIRGTATGWLRFTNMVVPKENILGAYGKGLKVALTVLDFGRTTFGACCTGAAKTALELAVTHAKKRKQFRRSLGEFELIRQKIGRMAAWTYAMEAMTYVTANLIDRGFEDFMLETAMLKVWSTDALWTIINDSFQIHGGAAYFTDMPLERMVRDARINQIGEGANEVLKSFIALVGMRGPGEQLKSVYDSATKPWTGIGPIYRYLTDRVDASLRTPTVPVHHPALIPFATELAGLIRKFGGTVQQQLFKHREEVLERQFVHERIAEASMELFAASCTLARLDAELEDEHPGHAQANGHAANGHHDDHGHGGHGPAVSANRAAAEFFLKWSFRKTRRWLAELNDNEDELMERAAHAALGG
jgi:alkylation response protein AidB-like acyl-CoA dehydrogenase